MKIEKEDTLKVTLWHYRWIAGSGTVTGFESAEEIFKRVREKMKTPFEIMVLTKEGKNETIYIREEKTGKLTITK